MLQRGKESSGRKLCSDKIAFLDYTSADDRGVSVCEQLSDESKEFISSVEKRAGIEDVDIMKTGPKSSHVVSRDNQD